MRTTRPPVVDGLSLALQAASSDTSTFTTATIQASYAIVPDFFNGLLEGAQGIERPLPKTDPSSTQDGPAHRTGVVRLLGQIGISPFVTSQQRATSP